jgi:hypothetical protein
LLAGYFKDTAQGAADPGVWMTPFVVAGVVCLLGAFVMSMAKRPSSVPTGNSKPPRAKLKRGFATP